MCTGKPDLFGLGGTAPPRSQEGSACIDPMIAIGGKGVVNEFVRRGHVGGHPLYSWFRPFQDDGWDLATVDLLGQSEMVCGVLFGGRRWNRAPLSRSDGRRSFVDPIPLGEHETSLGRCNKPLWPQRSTRCSVSSTSVADLRVGSTRDPTQHICRVRNGCRGAACGWGRCGAGQTLRPTTAATRGFHRTARPNSASCKLSSAQERHGARSACSSKARSGTSTLRWPTRRKRWA